MNTYHLGGSLPGIRVRNQLWGGLLGGEQLRISEEPAELSIEENSSGPCLPLNSALGKLWGTRISCLLIFPPQ